MQLHDDRKPPGRALAFFLGVCTSLLASVVFASLGRPSFMLEFCEGYDREKKLCKDRREISVIGEAGDLAIQGMTPKFRYRFSGGKIGECSDGRVDIAASMTAVPLDGGPSVTSQIEGSGVKQGRTAYMIYKGTTAGDDTTSWRGIGAIHITPEGPIEGHYVTEDTTESGNMLIGPLTFERRL